jgi:hypothetical protein
VFKNGGFFCQVGEKTDRNPSSWRLDLLPSPYYYYPHDKENFVVSQEVLAILIG